ncbi:MAG: late competence development ComFB family protein [Epulopiscium sp.]|nr:late competence development ComFB family protein [Candidatus Epulonipiscium sp.]
MVKNYMEQVVNELLPTVMEKYPDLKWDSDCVSDIKAIALNNLRPRYVATQKGEVYVKVDTISAQAKAKILSEITKAAEIVKQNPRNKNHIEDMD